MQPASFQIFFDQNRDFYQEILGFVFDEPLRTQILNLFSKDLETLMKTSTAETYGRYASLAAMRLLWDHIRSEKYKSQLIFRKNPALQNTDSAFSLSDFFCCLLKARYQYAPNEIAAVLGCAVGTILTRIERFEPLLKIVTEIEAAPLSAIRAALQEGASNSKEKSFLEFRSWPWYFKLTAQGALTTAVISLVLLATPVAKKTYETWIEKRPDLYSFSELVKESKLEAADTSRSTSATAKAIAAAPTATESAESLETESEFLGKNSEKPSSDKVYRILIKNSASSENRRKIHEYLQKITFSPAEEDAGVNLEIPGGVIFDVLVGITNYETLFQELSQLGEVKVIITRSKDKPVKDKVRVKIWLQKA